MYLDGMHVDHPQPGMLHPTGGRGPALPGGVAAGGGPQAQR